MDFGKVSLAELPEIDFTLPDEPKTNKAILAKGKGNTRFFIGCAKWGRKDWVGKLYPINTREKDFLACYATQFNTVEFNGFFYNKQSREQVEKWAVMVPDDFLFCPKFTQSITHYKRLKNVDTELDSFLDILTAFGNKLGPLFLMPHPQMAVKSRLAIAQFIETMPIDVPLFLELRHKSWYAYESGYDPEMLKFMEKHRRGLVITDTAGRRDCVHMHLSTPECFIRFVGNGLHDSDYTRIDGWVGRIAQWIDKGLETCYFFMHQHNELHSPELIKYFILEMNKRIGSEIPLPQSYTEL